MKCQICQAKLWKGLAPGGTNLVICKLKTTHRAYPDPHVKIAEDLFFGVALSNVCSLLSKLSEFSVLEMLTASEAWLSFNTNNKEIFLPYFNSFIAFVQTGPANGVATPLKNSLKSHLKSLWSCSGWAEK